MKKIIVALILIIVPLCSGAQSNSISLVVSGEGNTKTDAECMALRSAISQAFGTFVSSNMQILNDELVKDEIATVSSGNIESYQIISETNTGEKWIVTLKALVSINKLVEYAQSHGSSVEFAGRNFAMTMKMRKLNKDNEEQALSQLVKTVEQLSGQVSFFDYKLNIKPTKYVSESIYEVPLTISCFWNDNGIKVLKLIQDTFNSLGLPEAEALSYNETNFPMTCILFHPIYSYLEILTKSYLYGPGVFSMRSSLDYLHRISYYLAYNIFLNLHCFTIETSGKKQMSFDIVLGMPSLYALPQLGGNECKSWKSLYDALLYPNICKLEPAKEFDCNIRISEDKLSDIDGIKVYPDLNLRNDCVCQPVDLGLSVKWSNVNLGASCLEPEGDVYCWGGSECNFLRFRSESIHNAHYFMPDLSESLAALSANFLKYNGSDNKKVLELCDDVTHLKCGGDWRMPTVEEWRELMNNCSFSLVEGVGGDTYLEVRSKKPGYTDKFILLPYTRMQYMDDYYDGDHRSISIGHYWSSTLGRDTSCAFAFEFDGMKTISIDERYRNNLCYIRPVQQ